MQESSRKQIIRVATSNRGKFDEIRSLLKRYGLDADMVEGKTLEIQHDELKAIAETALREALSIGKGPLLLEDAGLFIDALKGFPGPYSAYVYRTIGVEGILRLMKGVENRIAEFRSVAAYGETVDSIKLFEGSSKGRIAEAPKGRGGFGFDPIFTPLGYLKTFAEIPIEKKNQLSHRAEAVRRFAEWYVRNRIKS
ncbi:MAG: RdgB/HAM1 family non-canonical purine NTP pyrophosphatase [Thaumarchaeota archaeon]|nr:RdgB/HAM1 family non-canonical purine NTP pyrophosphatase [Nitrososphaerota archaeon]